MEKLYFQEYRDEKAKKLIEKRAEGEKEESTDDLRTLKDEQEYRYAKILHQISREIGKEKLKTALKNTERPELEDDYEKWEVKDIVSELPLSVQFEIDASVMAAANTYSTRDPRYVPFQNMFEDLPGSHARKIKQTFDGSGRDEDIRIELYNDLSEGRYLDTRNLRHSVAAGAFGSAEKYSGMAFDRDSIIEPSRGVEYGQDGFWFNSSKATSYSSAYNPMAIISPDNPGARKFFEDTFYPPIKELLEKIEKDYPGDKFKDRLRVCMKNGGFAMIEPFSRLFFLAGLKLNGGAIFIPFETRRMRVEREKNGQSEPIKLDVTFKDISDCIVDLPHGKMFTRKYSVEEKEQVLISQQKYRKWIEDHLGCTLEELIEEGSS